MRDSDPEPVATRWDEESLWRLSVEGDGVDEPMELTYDDIRSLPSRTIRATCSISRFPTRYVCRRLNCLY